MLFFSYAFYRRICEDMNRKTTLESMQERMERTRKEKKTLLGGDE